jgi:UDP-2-acetamido-3-amino-2,3-dideoxy-glucuronate N-acetyltransferase
MAGAIVGDDCNIGDHAFIEGGARIGNRVTIKNGVMIWDGVTIEDDVFIGPGVLFTNDRHPRSPRMEAVAKRYRDPANWLEPTKVERGSTIGAGAIVLAGVSIGACATVGAAALVTRDVAPHRVVIGQPAQASGWVCACGVPLDEALRCQACNRAYHETSTGLKARP